MVKKIEFLLFIPAFIMLYYACGSGNIILGRAGIILLVMNAMMVLVAEKLLMYK